jgi:hypothetical protein
MFAPLRRESRSNDAGRGKSQLEAFLFSPHLIALGVADSRVARVEYSGSIPQASRLQKLLEETAKLWFRSRGLFKSALVVNSLR